MHSVQRELESNQPMPSGETDIQSANPPANPKPDTIAIAKLSKADKEAK